MFVTLISFEIDVIHKIKDLQLFYLYEEELLNFSEIEEDLPFEFFRKMELCFTIF